MVAGLRVVQEVGSCLLVLVSLLGGTPNIRNIDPQTVGFPYHEDPNKVPLISETPI